MDGSVKVTYVDYGNSEELSSTDLRKLDSQFKEIPITVRLKLMEDSLTAQVWESVPTSHTLLRVFLYYRFRFVVEAPVIRGLYLHTR